MILILDFGSQYTQLIARRIREARVYCEIHPYNLPIEKIRALQPRGIIFSGGPASLYESGAPDVGREVLELGCPVLGICYGLYVIAHHLGAASTGAREREYGPATLEIDAADPLFDSLPGRRHEGVESVARQNQHTMLVACSHGKSDVERELIEVFMEQGVAGIIVVPSDPKQNQGYYRGLIEKGVRLVFVDREIQVWMRKWSPPTTRRALIWPRNI